MVALNFKKRDTELTFYNRKLSKNISTASSTGNMLAQNDFMVDENGDNMIFVADAPTKLVVLNFKKRDIALTFYVR